MTQCASPWGYWNIRGSRLWFSTGSTATISSFLLMKSVIVHTSIDTKWCTWRSNLRVLNNVILRWDRSFLQCFISHVLNVLAIGLLLGLNSRWKFRYLTYLYVRILLFYVLTYKRYFSQRLVSRVMLILLTEEFHVLLLDLIQQVTLFFHFFLCLRSCTLWPIWIVDNKVTDFDLLHTLLRLSLHWLIQFNATTFIIVVT